MRTVPCSAELDKWGVVGVRECGAVEEDWLLLWGEEKGGRV